jgi:hypothetical protein
VRAALTRLRRRLAVGLFVDVWPAWAAAGCVVAGTVVAICRMFVDRAAPLLPWLWLTPLLMVLPVLAVCARRAFRGADVTAIADSLGGGHGLLLTLSERDDPAWTRSVLLEKASSFPLPRVRLRRALLTVLPAIAFLAVAMLLPQWTRAAAVDAALAEEIAAKLTAAVVQLKQQALIDPAEERRLEQEIARIREAAERRVDPSSWEAADALREQMTSAVAEKQQAARWAQESFARYAAAVLAGGGAASAAPQAAELTKALEKLAKSGLLAGAPPELQALMNGGQLPGDAASLKNLAAALAKFLNETNGRLGQVAGLGQEFGRFNPGDFPLGTDAGQGDIPGRGGVSEGRADADLTWGNESAKFDRFKAQPLPPGSARSPDDWAPVVTMPGAPQESTAVRGGGTARDYAAGAGQGAWRRSLAPRHQSVVKKYFATIVKQP